MSVIGITGGIGSGKSVVAKILQSRGYLFFDTDSEAKSLYSNLSVIDKITHTFGAELIQNGRVDFTALADVVFSDTTKLVKLNQIIHPAVIDSFVEWKNNNKDKNLCVESALLIECGLYKEVDKIIVVTSPLELRLTRLQKYRNIDNNQALKRIDNQISDKEMLKYATHHIVNDDRQSVIEQLIEFI